MIDSGIGNDNQTGLLERTGDVVGEVTGSKATGNGLCTGVGSVFEDSSVSVGASGNNTDIVGVFYGGDNTSSKYEFLPGLSNVDDVNTWWVGLDSWDGLEPSKERTV